MKKIDKSLLVSALAEGVAARLRALTDSQQASQAGATHEEARPEHAKDTRSVEASYLARGLARRVEALQSELDALATLELRDFGPEDAIGLTALVGIEQGDGETSVVWIAPVGAGEQIEVEGQAVRVVTPSSPLGRSLMGRHVEDEFSLDLPSGPEEICVRWVL